MSDKWVFIFQEGNAAMRDTLGGKGAGIAEMTNIGLNDDTVQGLARLTGNDRFAYDAYRRFIQMFGRIVLGIGGEKFDHIFDEHKRRIGAKYDTELGTDDLKRIVADYKAVVKRETGQDFPTEPLQQLDKAIRAVFNSWNGKRAFDYRNFNKIPHDLGTAVNVQVMVFGNMGDRSGTGVCFTRNPSTGERKLYGEYLTNAQGEDVVAGIRTPKKIAEMEQEWPGIHRELIGYTGLLEKHYRDMQDIEFTIEQGKLYLLQTRSGKRTAMAAIKVAVDMVGEAIISKEEAVGRVEPDQVDQLLLPRFDPAAKEEAIRSGRLLAEGLNASPGAATGKAVFDPDPAEGPGREGGSGILVRQETDPEDVHGIISAKGVLTSRGGATSHAAVVARGLGKPCVAGCEAIKVDVG